MAPESTGSGGGCQLPLRNNWNGAALFAAGNMFPRRSGVVARGVK